jgi:hypothetical protein
MNDFDAKSVSPVRSDAVSVSPTPQAPPHPLDTTWHLSVDEEVYGPYSGHQISDYIHDGRIDANTNVLREGAADWTKAAADSRLASLFLPRAPTKRDLPASITAERGATIVPVTNQIQPHPQVGLDVSGPFGPKSPGLALILSIVIVGAGQMYNGQVAKGIGMMLLCILLWFAFLGWIINLWSWFDAYQTATVMRDRYQRRLAAGLPV